MDEIRAAISTVLDRLEYEILQAHELVRQDALIDLHRRISEAVSREEISLNELEELLDEYRSLPFLV